MALRTLFKKNLFWRAFYFGTNVLLTIVLARSLSAENIGSLYFDIALISLFIQVAGFSLESGIGYYSAGNKLNQYLLAAIGVIWTIIISSLALLFFGWDTIASLSATRDGIDTHLLVSFVSGNLLYNYFSSMYYGKLNFETPNVVGAIVQLLLFLFILAGLLGYKPWQQQDIIVSAFFYSFLIKGVLLAFSYLAFSKRLKSSVQISPADIRHLFKYSLIAWIANTVTFLLYRLDYYFVERFCENVALGNYTQVTRITQLLLVIPGIVATVVFPLSSSSNDSKLMGQKVSQAALLLFYLNIFICLFICMTGYWLFPYVFGNDFALMYSLFLLLMPGVILYSCIFPLTAHFAGQNQIRHNVIGAFIGLCILTTLDVLFVPKGGVYAAAIINSIAYSASAMYTLHIFKKQNKNLFIDLFRFPLRQLRITLRN